MRVPKVFYTAAARLPFPPASAGRFLKQRLMGEERRKAREEEEEEKAAAFPISCVRCGIGLSYVLHIAGPSCIGLCWE